MDSDKLRFREHATKSVSRAGGHGSRNAGRIAGGEIIQLKKETLQLAWKAAVNTPQSRRFAR
jgi:hypothetical protein